MLTFGPPMPDGDLPRGERERRAVVRQPPGSVLRSKRFIAGWLIAAAWVVAAAVPAIGALDPLAQDLLSTNSPPSPEHLFGTDALGRDVVSRVLAGSREVLIVAFSAALIGTLLGTVIGGIQAYARGVVDLVLGRLIEVFISLPLVIVVFVIIAAVGASTPALVLVIALATAVLVSRTIRAAAMREIALDYVAAARMRGESAIYVLVVEVLPNLAGVAIVELTTRLGYAVFAVATLSFLGMGVGPPTPDWGADVATAYPYLAAGYWWQTLFPSLALASLILGVNLICSAAEERVIR